MAEPQHRYPLAIGSEISPFAETSGESPLYVLRKVPEARLPARQSRGAAGYDLSSCEDVVDLQPGARLLVSTGLSIEIPKGHYGRIAPRSGLALKSGITVGAGVIDSDYRGTVGILIFNHGDYPFSLPSGSRIAQLIIEKIATPRIIEISEGTATRRGSGGFGSTGIVISDGPAKDLVVNIP